MNELYEAFARIAAEQGWEPDTQVMVLCEAIQGLGLHGEYAREVLDVVRDVAKHEGRG